MSLLSSLRSILYQTTAKIERLAGFKPPLLTILCYHSFGDDDWFFSTKPEIFESQLAALSRYYQFVSITEAEAHIFGQHTLSKPSILITIDDGYQDVERISTICQRYGVKPIVFLLGSPESANRVELDNQKAFLQPNQIRNLLEAGWSFGSHTLTHPNLAKLSPADQEKELFHSKELLEKKYGFECRAIAYPRGSYTPETLKLSKKAGYCLGFTTDYYYQITSARPFEIPRIGVNATHQVQDLLTANARSSYFIRYLVATFLK